MIRHIFILFLLLVSVFSTTIYAQYPYSLPSLPYSYSAIEPYIDSTTMYIHYNRHHAAYVKNLNEAIKGTELEKLSLDELFQGMSRYSAQVRNNAGGHYNHTLFWSLLSVNRNTEPSAHFLRAVNEQFGSLDSLKNMLNRAAMTQFGSGWAWLIITKDKKLLVCSTPNQDNPLMETSTIKGTPIIGIDVWEHAYYLKYQNKRVDYLTAFWSVINWDQVNKNFETIVPKGKFDSWPQIKDFHKVMSQTFHPSEEGNLLPIKTRIDEMVTKAIALKSNSIPNEFNTLNVQNAVVELERGAIKLQKQIKSGASDESIKKALSALHDVFHKIVGLCSNEDHSH